MHIGIMGAGAIGCYVGGRLAAKGRAEVTFVGRPSLQREIAERRLTIRELDQDTEVDPERFRFETEVDALSGCDVVLCCVKSGATAEAGSALAGVLRSDAVVVSLQNGVRNPEVLRASLRGQRVVAGVVGFNVVRRDGAVFHHTTTGPIVLESRPADAAWVAALRAAGITVEERVPIAPEQWTKLLVNLNNAITALSGAPTRELILSRRYRTLMAMLLDEGLRVLDAAQVPRAKFRGVPLRLMSVILRLPTPLVRVIVRAQLRIDPESRASMWQDLERHRPTEVEYLNGEIVRLAETCAIDAPLNRRIVELVHEAERADAGCPRMSAEALRQELVSPRASGP
jgi:2-dehydropantoate 2-reductase